MKKHRSFIILTVIAISFSCGNSSPSVEVKDVSKEERIVIPEFNPDSAYYFVEKQVGFGPRVPNTETHKACGDWLIKELARFSDTVFVQPATVRAFDGTMLSIRNIIGSFNPERRNRILLCAHWDTRPFADADPDPENHYKPIDGANDGASGVGVLLEIARTLSNNKPSLGVDIILFDAEDYGKHESFRGAAHDSWALGSQYWAKNPHTQGYYAKYGILLDMVGAENARFIHERYSYYFAPAIVRKVWSTAQRIGYSNYFINEQGNYIIDDHYYTNTILGIPTINIIHQESIHGHGFFKEWHTMGDNMDIIDRETLKAVGQTVITVIFEDN